MEDTNQVKIDLRPPYVFAFYTRSMEFGIIDIVYYSKKDKLLHYKHKSSDWSFMSENDKDREYLFAIADEDINALREVFGLVIDAYNSYIERDGERWFVCDGSECAVICGRKRIHFEGPGLEPLESFSNMVFQTLMINEERERPDFEELRKQLPMVRGKLLSYLNDK